MSTLDPPYFESTGTVELVDGTLKFKYRSSKAEELFWMDNLALAVVLFNLTQRLTIFGGFCLNLSPEIIAMIQNEGKIPHTLASVTETEESFDYDFTVRIAILSNKVEAFLEDWGMDPINDDHQRADWSQTRPVDEVE